MILLFEPNKFSVLVSSISKKLLLNLIGSPIHMPLSVVRYRCLSRGWLFLSYRRWLVLLIRIVTVCEGIDSV